MSVNVFAAPKGGTGKSCTVVQLAKLLGNKCKCLDLDDNKNTGVAKFAPEYTLEKTRLSEEQLSKTLEAFYDGDKILLVDCGGYLSQRALSAMAKSDRIYMPLKVDATTIEIAKSMSDTLAVMSKQMDYHYVARVIYVGGSWNSKYTEMTEALNQLPHIKVLGIHIENNASVRKMELSETKRVRNALEQLAADLES